MVIWYLGVTLAAVLGSSSAGATIVTNGCALGASCTLGELLNGGALTVNGLRFSGWSILDSSSVAIDQNAITVAGRDGNANEAGLEFLATTALGVPATEVIDFTVDYSVTSPGSAVAVTGAASDLSGFSFSGANDAAQIFVTEEVVDAAGTSQALLFVSADNGTSPILALVDSAAFPPQSALQVSTGIGVFAGPDSTASLTQLTQSFSIQPVSQVPVPGSLVLVGSGLVSFAFRRRSRRGHR